LEGVIKYKCEWQNLDCIAGDEVAELNFYRNKIWKRSWIGEQDGVGFGNISQRCRKNSAHFIISGSQTGHCEILENTQYAKVTYSKIKNNILFCQGKIQASSESLTHAVLYELSADIQAVIHIHEKKFWHKNIDKLPTSDKKAEYGTPQIAQSVRFLFTNKMLSNTFEHSPILPNIIIMGGHEDGILVFGESLAQATQFLIDCFECSTF
jgi:L-ribulose-5-phosphate 4-epimerase